LRSAPIYVLPAHNEGLPVSVLEAIAAGAAVVTTQVGGFPQLITDGVHWTPVEPGDLDGLAAALNTLLGDRATQNRCAPTAIWWRGVAIGLFWQSFGAWAFAAPFIALVIPPSPSRLSFYDHKLRSC
jgi:glycosyltransferase involved in cell wall biosynthesis